MLAFVRRYIVSCVSFDVFVTMPRPKLFTTFFLLLRLYWTQSSSHSKASGINFRFFFLVRRRVSGRDCWMEHHHKTIRFEITLIQASPQPPTTPPSPPPPSIRSCAALTRALIAHSWLILKSNWPSRNKRWVMRVCSFTWKHFFNVTSIPEHNKWMEMNFWEIH